MAFLILAVGALILGGLALVVLSQLPENFM
jgi:hypothetical protein